MTQCSLLGTFFLCTNLIRFNSRSSAAAWIQMVQAKTFCFVHGQLITGNEWGRRESVSIEQIKK